MPGVGRESVCQALRGSQYARCWEGVSMPGVGRESGPVFHVLGGSQYARCWEGVRTSMPGVGRESVCQVLNRVATSMPGVGRESGPVCQVLGGSQDQYARCWEGVSMPGVRRESGPMCQVLVPLAPCTNGHGGKVNKPGTGGPGAFCGLLWCAGAMTPVGVRGQRSLKQKAFFF